MKNRVKTAGFSFRRLETFQNQNLLISNDTCAQNGSGCGSQNRWIVATVHNIQQHLSHLSVVTIYDNP